MKNNEPTKKAKQGSFFFFFVLRQVRMPRPFFLFIIWIAFRAHCGPSVSMAVDWCWERSSNAVCLDEKDGHDACAVNWLTTERKRIQQKRKGKKKKRSQPASDIDTKLLPSVVGSEPPTSFKKIAEEQVSYAVKPRVIHREH